MEKGIRLRKCTCQVLSRVIKHGETMDQALSGQDLSQEGRAWVQARAGSVLRNRALLLAHMKSQTQGKLPTGEVLRQLLIAVDQIHNGKIPPEKVVNEAVSAIKFKAGVPTSKFANSLLRKIVQNKPPKLEAPESYSLPPWIWEGALDYGEEFAHHFGKSMQSPPRVWVCAMQMPKGAEPGPIPGSWLLGEGATLEGMGLHKKDWFVQNLSSQRVIHELDLPPGTFLDLCAAPGGKTLGLAWRGWKGVACELKEDRRTKLEENLKTHAIEGVVVTTPDEVKGEFDLVWVDAPCSGSGTVDKHPEIRWNRSQEQVEELIRLQAELIQKGLSHVKPGGHLLYSVCSVLPSEGRDQVKGLSPKKEWVLPEVKGQGEGFYAALISK